jgi:hypothetical protein
MSLHKIKSALLPVLLAVGVIVLAGYPLRTARGDSANEPAANAGSEENMAEKVIHVTSLVKGCRAEVFLNDIPLCMIDGSGIRNSGDPVRQYVIEGENVLTMVIGPGPTPNTAKTEPREGEEKATPDMKALATLSYYEEGAWLDPGGGDVQAEIRWTGENEDSFPLVLTATANLSTGLGPWKWQSADVLTLDDSTLASACEAVESIRDYFFKGDAAAINKMAKHHYKELYQAYPAWPKGMMEEGMTESLKRNARRSSWKPAKLTREDFELRLVAGGRLLEVIDKEWQPIIREEEEGGVDYRVMIGRIEGEWHILR